MNCPLVIKSHNSYSYLWKIINDYVQNLDLEIYLCLNRNDTEFEFDKRITVLEYDENLSYPQRMSSILEKLNDDYVFISHDVDLILDFDKNKFNEYLDMVKSFSLDRLSLGVFNNPSEEICANNNSICALTHTTKNFYTPFDYAPSICDRKSFIEFYNEFPDDTYGSLELNQKAQNYFKENMKSYGIQKQIGDKLIYHRGMVYSEFFNFLHITIKGGLLNDPYYYDLTEKKNEIVSKYGLDFLPRHNTNPIDKQEL